MRGAKRSSLPSNEIQAAPPGTTHFSDRRAATAIWKGSEPEMVRALFNFRIVRDGTAGQHRVEACTKNMATASNRTGQDGNKDGTRN